LATQIATTTRPTDTTPIRPTIPQPTTFNGGNGQGESLLPRRPACGPNSFLDRVYNGNNTAIDDFVWMALLEYRDRK